MNNAAQLFDAILHQAGFRTDAELAEALEIEPSYLSRLRHERRPISDGMVLCIHEITNWAIRDIKGALGMRSYTGPGTGAGCLRRRRGVTPD